MGSCKLCGENANRTIDIENGGEVVKYDICQNCYQAFESISNSESVDFDEKIAFLKEKAPSLEEDEFSNFVNSYISSCDVKKDEVAEEPDAMQEDVTSVLMGEEIFMPDALPPKKKFFDGFLITFLKALSIFIAIAGFVVAIMSSRQVVNNANDLSVFFSGQVTTRVEFNAANFFHQYITYVFYSVVIFAAAEVLKFLKKK